MMKTQVSLKRIAKYEIQRVLGSGAMGIVYKGYDSQIERTVAVKLLHEHLRMGTNGDVLEERFLQEAKAAARCLHPNIVAIFDFGIETAPYIVMEYVEGIELRAHMQNGTEISLPSATDIAIQVLSALGHAHSKGIVHRDIKPENIIILESGAVKVSDFGVARLDTSDLTGTGFMIGTPSYMSPEGLQGLHCDGRADIYSVGVLFFELVSESRFSRELDLEQNLQKLDDCRMLSPKNILCLRRILKRALEADRQKRYQATADFIGDLKSIDDMDLALATLAVFPRPKDYEATALAQTPGSSVSQWNSEVLDALEQSFARHVGPIARQVIRKSARTASNVDELVAQLVEHIPIQSERTQFIRAVAKSGVHSKSPSMVSQTSGSGSGSGSEKARGNTEVVSQEQQKILADILIFYTGPIANRLIKKLVKQSNNLAELLELCSQHIPESTERQEFLQRCRKIEG